MGPPSGLPKQRVPSPSFTDFYFHGARLNFIDLVKDQIDRLQLAKRGGISIDTYDTFEFRRRMVVTGTKDDADLPNDMARSLDRLSQSDIMLKDGIRYNFGALSKHMVAYKCNDTSKKLRKRTLFLRGALGVMEAQLSKINLNIEHLVTGGYSESKAIKFARGQHSELARLRGMVEELLLLSESLGSARKEALLVREMVELQGVMNEIGLMGGKTIQPTSFDSGVHGLSRSEFTDDISKDHTFDLSNLTHLPDAHSTNVHGDAHRRIGDHTSFDPNIDEDAGIENETIVAQAANLQDGSLKKDPEVHAMENADATELGESPDGTARSEKKDGEDETDQQKKDGTEENDPEKMDIAELQAGTVEESGASPKTEEEKDGTDGTQSASDAAGGTALKGQSVAGGESRGFSRPPLKYILGIILLLALAAFLIAKAFPGFWSTLPIWPNQDCKKVFYQGFVPLDIFKGTELSASLHRWHFGTPSCPVN